MVQHMYIMKHVHNYVLHVHVHVHVYLYNVQAMPIDPYKALFIKYNCWFGKYCIDDVYSFLLVCLYMYM